MSKNIRTKLLFNLINRLFRKINKKAFKIMKQTIKMIKMPLLKDWLHKQHKHKKESQLNLIKTARPNK